MGRYSPPLPSGQGGKKRNHLCSGNEGEEPQRGVKKKMREDRNDISHLFPRGKRKRDVFYLLLRRTEERKKKKRNEKAATPLKKRKKESSLHFNFTRGKKGLIRRDEEKEKGEKEGGLERNRKRRKGGTEPSTHQ